MADLRLLMRTTAAPVCVLSLLLSGCVPIPHLLRMQEIHGRVVDGETGAALSDAEVFATYKVMSNTRYGGAHSAISSWTPTDAEGRFHFEKGWEWVSVLWPGSWLAEVPFFKVFHKDYGLARWDFYRDEKEGRGKGRDDYLVRGMASPYLPDLGDLTIYVWESTLKAQQTDPGPDGGYHMDCVGLTAAGCDRLQQVRRLQE